MSPIIKIEKYSITKTANKILTHWSDLLMLIQLFFFENMQTGLLPVAEHKIIKAEMKRDKLPVAGKVYLVNGKNNF